MSTSRLTGIRGFTVVWIGQIVSLLGTNMTGFALSIWAYQVTGSATALALVQFFFVTPLIIMSPIAGALVDRSNRKLMMMVSNLLFGLAFAVFALMILARTSSDEASFAAVQTAAAIGGVAGGVAMSAWGGPRRRVHGVLLGWTLTSLVSALLLGAGQALPMWIVGVFVGSFLTPVINGSNQAIWQAKVTPDVQGRVFATRRLIAWLTSPLTPLIAGPLSDLVLEPAMQAGGGLAGVFGGLVGSGPGAGMALLFVGTGVLGAIVGLGAYLVPAVRDAEVILPDHDAQPALAVAVEAT